jgi:hypothetical protein
VISVLSEVERLDRQSQRDAAVDRERGPEGRALSVDLVGPRKFISAGTMEIAAGGTETVYLTYTGEVGGENVFSKRPRVVVWEDGDDTPGGVVRASGPAAADSNMTLVTPTDITARVRYFGADRVWAVEITNNDSAAHGFVVDGEGF